MVIGFILLLGFIGTCIKDCECAVLKLSEEEPPYYSTDDDRYHRQSCPFMNEDNYVGDEYFSREDAENEGLHPCPHCLN